MTPDSNWLSRALNRGSHPNEENLHHCAACGKDFVNPVDWEPVTPETWWMRLRCGECHVWREVTVTNQVAERFDLELDRHADLNSFKEERGLGTIGGILPRSYAP
jgi:hypothetical protein